MVAGSWNRWQSEQACPLAWNACRTRSEAAVCTEWQGVQVDAAGVEKLPPEEWHCEHAMISWASPAPAGAGAGKLVTITESRNKPAIDWFRLKRAVLNMTSPGAVRGVRS
jgi:hypothetical protein